MTLSFKKLVKSKIRLTVFKITNKSEQKFECPICGYVGPFMPVKRSGGTRIHARCPKCGAMERHRLQSLVIDKVLKENNVCTGSILHFAPEIFFENKFKKIFTQYESADLTMKNVDYHVDLTSLPFQDASYDFVYASHVLEHIKDDIKAVSEIRRVLKPDGIAILPVPILATKTIEYPTPNPREEFHVRAPGLDYYDRYEIFFSRVEKYTSNNFPELFQVFIYEDRSKWPLKEFPLRVPTPGNKHIDVVPICYV